MSFIITANILLLATLASGQTVNLSRMQRALGEGRIIYTDSLGKQEYRILTNILDTTVVDTATYLLQDTILVYYAGGTEFGRDTIRPASVSGGSTNFGSGTDGYYTVWSGDTLADGRMYNFSSTVVALNADNSGSIEMTAGPGYVSLNRLRYGSLSLNNTLYLGGITSAPSEPTPVILGKNLAFQYGTGGTFDSLNVNFGTGTNDVLPRFSADTLRNSGVISNGTTIAFDPGLNGVYDVSIGESLMNVESITASLATTTLFLTVNGPSSANTTHLGGFDTNNAVTKMAVGEGLEIAYGTNVDTIKSVAGAPAYAQLISNSSESISATTFTKFAPSAGWTEIESGVLDADGANDRINPTDTITAKVEFSANVYMDGGSFAGNVTFRIYKNGSFEAPISCSVGPFSTDENKLMHLQAIVELAPNDEIEVYYSLSTALGAGTMYAYAPTLNVTKL